MGLRKVLARRKHGDSAIICQALRFGEAGGKRVGQMNWVAVPTALQCSEFWVDLRHPCFYLGLMGLNGLKIRGIE